MPTPTEHKRHFYPLGKASLIAGIVACVLLSICLKWIHEFRKICPVEGCGIGHRLFGELWNVLFGVSLFAAPPIAIAGVVMAVISLLKKQEQYKKQTLIGAGMSALVLIIYLLYFIIIAFL